MDCYGSLRITRKTIRNAHKWAPLIPLIKPDTNISEVLRDYRKQYAELRKEELDILNRFQIYKQRSHREYIPSDFIPGISPSAPDSTQYRIEGLLRPTNYIVYPWSPPEQGFGNTRYVESKLYRRGTIDERMDGEYWLEVDDISDTGAIGFRGHFEADEDDSMSLILCLEYRLPFLPECDSIMAWHFRARAAFINGVKVYGDEHTYMNVDTVFHEQPESRGFPEVEDFKRFILCDSPRCQCLFMGH